MPGSEERHGVTVAVRTRPTASFAADRLNVSGDSVSIEIPKREHSCDNAKDWTWKFDAVLHNSSQEAVYNEVVLPVVQSVLQGHNGTIMCYGQAGAGKTYTQLGGTGTADRGVSPRSIAEIFKYVHNGQQSQSDATIGVTYLEIYNDALIDLLVSPPSQETYKEPLSLIEDSDGATHVKGLRIKMVTSEEKAIELLVEGETNRAATKHAHAVFTVHLQLRSRVERMLGDGTVELSEKVVRCKLNLVDLAGSERVKAGASSELKAESMYINRSLSSLERVVVALGRAKPGKAEHTPYRQSKLTHLLKDSLGGNCKTLLIANIYGEASILEETVATLQFAARMRVVQNLDPNSRFARGPEFQDPAIMLKKHGDEIGDARDRARDRRRARDPRFVLSFHNSPTGSRETTALARPQPMPTYGGLRTPPYARGNTHSTSAATARPASASGASRIPPSPPNQPRVASAGRRPRRSTSQAAEQHVHSPGQPPFTVPALPEAYSRKLCRDLPSPETEGKLQLDSPEQAQPITGERQALCAAAQQKRTMGGRAIVSRKWWRYVGHLAAMPIAPHPL